MESQNDTQTAYNPYQSNTPRYEIWKELEREERDEMALLKGEFDIERDYFDDERQFENYLMDYLFRMFYDYEGLDRIALHDFFDHVKAIKDGVKVRYWNIDKSVKVIEALNNDWNIEI